MPDLALYGSSVDNLILDLVDERHRKRETVEFHHVQHAQVFLLLRVVLLVGIEVYSR